MKHRNIVLILGNGFDLDIGLKTSYKDFWESKFCPKDYPAPLIRHLNSKWDDLEGVKWYDLENELLRYYEETFKADFRDLITPRQQEFLKVWSKRRFINRYEYPSFETEIAELLKKHLIYVDPAWDNYMSCDYQEDLILSAVERDRKALSLIKQGLCDYLCEITQVGIKEDSIAVKILQTLEDAYEGGAQVSVFSFNYTDVTLAYPQFSGDIVKHVHGSCGDNNIIVGTKDVDMTKRDYVFLQKAFDKNFNPPAIVTSLQDATDVIIFGHSLGVNDSQYFRDFFEQQSSRGCETKRIILVTRDDESLEEINYSLQALTGTRLSAFRAHNEVRFIQTSPELFNADSFDGILSALMQ